MSVYYKKEENKNYMEIIVENKKSDFNIVSGDENKFKLVYKNQNIFWGQIHRYFDEIGYIKGYNDNYFPYITSTHIENRKNLNKIEKLESWGKFFIKSLEKINFFYDGTWHMTSYLGEKEFYKGEDNRKLYTFGQYSEDRVSTLDWEDDKILGSKRVEEDGRLKWWRKKIREDNLPPILLWFIPPLDSYLIIDGHSRLKASEIEGIRPDLLIINPVKKINIPVDEKRVEAIMKSIKGKNLSTIKLNSILMSLYCNNEYYGRNLLAQGQYNFEEVWNKEVEEIIESNKNEDNNSRELKFD